MQGDFLAGAQTVSWSAKRHLFTPTPTVYVSFWVKYSTNWVGSGQTYHPHEFVILSDLDGDWDGPSDNYLTAYIENVYNNGGYPRLALQDSKNVNLNFGTPPNNLVGVVWMGLDKPGIGMHGTNNPETIGRAASHGCIRLANWDAARVKDLVSVGNTVIIF